MIVYHLRQAFKSGEVGQEEANRIGQELALKLTKRDHAFIVCAHVDKHHIHNHIIINSTTLDCQKTRTVYVEYRKAGYSKKFRAAHEGEILIHQAAKKHFDELGITKLPSVKSLREEYAGFLEQKRKAYASYKQARADMFWFSVFQRSAQLSPQVMILRGLGTCHQQAF